MSILNWLSRGEQGASGQAQGDANIAPAIELAVLGIDTRLRLVQGYAKHLLPAVERAWAHCAALAAAIPGTIDLLPDAWGREPGVRALFAQPTEIEDLLVHSLELAAFADAAATVEADHLYAAISLVRTEQMTLGWAKQGEVVRKDVAQRAVSFSRHRLLAPSTSLAALRQEMQWRAYEHLVVETLARLYRYEEPASPVTRAKALLRERIQLLQGARAGLDALHRPPVADEAAFHALRRRLVENGRELASLQRHANSLEDRLQRVADILGKPAAVIAFDGMEDRLTALNTVARDDDEIAVRVRLAQIAVQGEQSYARMTCIVRMARDQLKPRRMDFSAAQRWL